MKYLGLILSIIIAWGIKGGSGWIAAKFGTEIDPATQAEAVSYTTGAILVGLVGAVEIFERLFWPRIKTRLLAWWDRKFPAPK